ncbi:MAG TPA: hypothetical protein VHG31_04585 [Stellaceae bacterium]|nr:hypothetical protein [Stellaceae bacterium]
MLAHRPIAQTGRYCVRGNKVRLGRKAAALYNPVPQQIEVRDQAGMRSGRPCHEMAFAFSYLVDQIVSFVAIAETRQNPLYPQPLFRGQ